jgi:hypothetical protein
MTPSITKNVILSIMALDTAKLSVIYAECRYVDVMLSVVILSVANKTIILSVVMLSVVMLSALGSF